MYDIGVDIVTSSGRTLAQLQMACLDFPRRVVNKVPRGSHRELLRNLIKKSALALIQTPSIMYSTPNSHKKV